MGAQYFFKKYTNIYIDEYEDLRCQECHALVEEEKNLLFIHHTQQCTYKERWLL